MLGLGGMVVGGEDFGGWSFSAQGAWLCDLRRGFRVLGFSDLRSEGVGVRTIGAYYLLELLESLRSYQVPLSDYPPRLMG